jgi:hypothetical protein
VHDAGLHPGLRERRLDRLREALEAVDAADEDVLDAAAAQVVEDGQPELAPAKPDVWARSLPDEDAKRVHDYVDSLSGAHKRGLAGTRDRLAILAESDVSDYLWRREPTRHNINLLAAVKRRDVVLFRLEADRRPLLASMLAPA